MAVNYVKFMRGTQTLYNSLTTKDSDTLYFVYENESANKGKLYLGNKLISGSSSIDGTISVSDIEGVVISEGLADGDFLVYDEAEHKWVNKTIAEALNVPVMVGATATTDGIAGLVPVPTAGNQDKYLRGDGTWGAVVATLSQQDATDISNLKSTVATLVGTDTGKSVATIVTEKVSELLIPENADESLDTLQEIADWIQSHPSDVTAINSSILGLTTRVSNLEDLLNGTEEADGLVERVQTLETTIGDFTSVPGTYLTIGSAVSYLNQSVTEINDRLRWHELDEEVE